MADVQVLGNGAPDGTTFGRSDDKLSFYGATPVVKATLTTAGTDIATLILEVTDIRAKLVALGLVA